MREVLACSLLLGILNSSRTYVFLHNENIVVMNCDMLEQRAKSSKVQKEKKSFRTHEEARPIHPCAPGHCPFFSDIFLSSRQRTTKAEALKRAILSLSFLGI